MVYATYWQLVSYFFKRMLMSLVLYLTKEFRKARDLAKAYDHIEDPKARPTVHELRALGAWLYEQQGFSRDYVQVLMGHATPEMTAYYQGGHEEKEVIYQHVQAGLKL